MCELVPFKAQTGKTVMVVDIKVDKLNKYLEMFPKLTSIDKVVLFGTALSDRCTEESALDLLLFYNDKFQYGYDMSITLLDEFPDSCYDATLGISSTKDISEPIGTVREALQGGITLYDNRQGGNLSS